MNKRFNKPLRTAASLAVLGFLSSNAFAGSFSLYTEGSPVYVGNYAAGAAAEAFDASTNWYNPAGLPLIRSPQVVFGGTGIFPVNKITGTSTFSTTGLPPYVQSFRNLDGAHDGFVPVLHAAVPLSDRVTFGFSVVSPFGLATKWKADSPVRYEATYSQLLTIDVAPSLGVRLTDYLSAGLGLDMQYARVKFNKIIGAPTLLPFSNLPPTFLDSLSYNQGQSYGFGFRAGVLLHFNDDHTRLGVNFQSQLNHQFSGYSILYGKLANPGPITGAGGLSRADSLTSNSVGLPRIVTISGYHDVNEQLALLASAVFTGWHSFKTIQLNGVVVGVPAGNNIAQTLVQTTSPQNYRNAWRFALGANYRVSDQFLLRVGGGYDQTPTNNVDRDIRLPDTNRWALSVGGHYQAYPSLGFDIGYTHLFGVGNTRINRNDPQGTISNYNVNALIDGSADLVGLQAVWTMDMPMPAPTK